MNPGGFDPDATQQVPLGATTVVMPARPAPPPAAPFVHRFGNLPTYLLARFAAFAIDVFLVAFVAGTFVFNAFDFGNPALAAHTVHFGPIAALGFGAALLFALLCEGIVGTTVGKALFALHVRRGDGGYAGFGRAVVRGLLRPIDMLLIGPLLIAVTPRRQRVGDLLAGTTVSRSPIGFFAPVIALALLAGLVWAQVEWGGGTTSAFGVAVETTTYGPPMLAGALGALVSFAGGSASGSRPAATATTEPSPAATAAPAAAETEAPAAAASDGSASGETPEPEATDAPAAGSTDAPASTVRATALPVSGSSPV